ncbi:MAG: GNAT family N-acetyltransferase [Chthonomonadales bacterium]|nr:GNAT family N-acetyltransferase [Chthonomonadales bacterium]
MRIVEAHEGDALRTLRDEWRALVERCEGATIYQTWEWNEAWWRVFGARKRLRLLAAREGDALVGLAPLYVSRHLGTPLRRLAFVGTGLSDYLDVIAPRGVAPRVCALVLRHLAERRDHDLADLQQLRPDAAMLELGRCHREALHGAGHAILVAQEPCPYVALPPTWDEYAARLGRKMRSNIGYQERLLGRAFERVENRLAGADDLHAAMDDLFVLHQRRWRARMLPGVLGGGSRRAFHRLVAERFAERGWLRLHTLRLDGRAAAALYCFAYRGRYGYYLGGFDPELARYSPGTVLTAAAIRQAIAEGCQEFDFLRGHEPYKYRWQPEERVNHRLLLSRPRSVRSHAMLRLNHLERYVEVRAKGFAERRGRSKTE